MSSVNKVIIVGNIGRDPETKYLPNGDCVCNISIATTESWKDKSTGEKKESTEWHRIVLYRRLGEIAAEYLAKGSQVYIEGSLKTRKWTDKDGVERYTTEIVADDMKMLGSKQSGGRSDDDGYGSPAPARGNNRTQNQGRPQGGQQRQQQQQQRHNDYVDDIPFMNPYFGKLCLAV